MTTRRGPYRCFGSVRLRVVLPDRQGYQDTQAVGMRFNFSDPLRLNRFTFNASYSPGRRIPSNERYHLRLQYRRYDWRAEAQPQCGRLLRPLRPYEDEP